MILNPNETIALVVSRSRTVNPPLCDLVLSAVSTRAAINHDILGLKFDSKHLFEDHVSGTVPRVSKNWYFEVVETYICVTSQHKYFEVTPLCYFVGISRLFSQSTRIFLRCGGLLLNVIFSFSSSRRVFALRVASLCPASDSVASLCPLPSFLSLYH